MKKITSLILTVFLLIAAFSTVYSAGAESGKVVFSLEYNEKNEATVKTGTEITVKCYVKNNINSSTLKVYALTNEVDFDGDFFEYMGGTQGFDDISVSLKEYSGGMKAVKFGGNYENGKTFANKQYIGSFVLKVKATEGESTIKNDSANATVSGQTSAYETAVGNLKIIVGEGAEEICTLTFDTNGGSTLEPVQKTKGATVNLSSCGTPTRDGYTFAGWFSDNSLTNPVSSVTLDANTTVYAKWNTSGGGGISGGGGGGISAYKLTFETNGGTAIDAVSVDKNTTVDLSKYTTAKSGFTFDGWYTDTALTSKVSEIKMTESTTVYAKWVTNASGSASYKPSIFGDEHTAYIVGKEDGCFYPDSNLTRAETAEMLYRLLRDDVRTEAQTTENDFSDIADGDWFEVSVSTLAKLGVIKGRSAEEFAPNEQITRAEFTAMLVRVSDIAYSGGDLFADISGHWANAYINNAASVDWVNGENGMFRPDDSITRAEAVTLLNRVLCRRPESKADLLDGMITPPDNTDESAWYYLAVQEAVNSHNYELKSNGSHEKWTSIKD